MKMQCNKGGTRQEIRKLEPAFHPLPFLLLNNAFESSPDPFIIRQQGSLGCPVEGINFDEGFEDSFVGISGLGSLVYACCRTSAAAKERSHAQLNHSPMPFQTCSGGPSTSRMLKDRIAYNTPKDG